jgi:hypothetical protein
MTRTIARYVLACATTMPSVSCGYAPVLASGGGGHMHVKLVRSLVADAVAADEVAQGAREELARYGALEGGEGYPRVEIEVLRAAESSEGLVAGEAGALAPTARATSLSLVARGWVVEEPGGDPERDSGDLRSEAFVTVDEGVGVPDPRAGVFHAADALRAAARRLGATIGRRAMGMPAMTLAAPDGP